MNTIVKQIQDKPHNLHLCYREIFSYAKIHLQVYAIWGCYAPNVNKTDEMRIYSTMLGFLLSGEAQHRAAHSQP